MSKNAKKVKKPWVAPKQFKMSEITSKNCCGSLDEKDFFSSVKKGYGHVHHTMTCPKELSNAEGKIDIALGIRDMSALNENLGEDKKTKSFTFRIVVYSEYAKALAATTTEIDTIMARLSPSAAPDTLRETLVAALKTRRPNVTGDEIQEAFSANVRTGKTLTPELLRQVATRLLLPKHLETLDPKGTALRRFCADLTHDYCEFLEANPELKEKIFGIIELNEKEMNAKAIDKMEFTDACQWEKHSEKHETMPKLIDYSKSPTIGCKIKTWPPKSEEETRPGQIVVDETGTTLGTEIYDLETNPMAQLPIATPDEFSHFTYAAGDNKIAEKNKPFFKLRGGVTIENPVFYWGGQKKQGVLQLTARRLEYWQRFEMRGGPKPLSDVDIRRRLMDARAELSEMAGWNEQQQEDEAGLGEKRGADVDHAVGADDEDRPPQKKPRLGDDV